MSNYYPDVDFYKDIDVYFDADASIDLEVDVDVDKDVNIDVDIDVCIDPYIDGNVATFVVEFETLVEGSTMTASATTTSGSSNSEVTVDDGFGNTIELSADAYGYDTFTEVDAVVLILDSVTTVMANGTSITA